MPEKKKILVIEDDRDLRRLLDIDLSPIAKVHQATNWLEGKNYFDEQKFDLILLDLMLPDTEFPLEPLTYIHSIDQDYPVVLMSANYILVDELMDQLMRLGLEDILYKPYSKDELLETVTPYFNTQQLRG